MKSEDYYDRSSTEFYDESKLDPAIKGVVRLLRKAGFRTFSSCQGARYDVPHGSCPWVRIHPDRGKDCESTRVRLHDFLEQQGFVFFSTSVVYTEGVHRWCQKHVEVSFPIRIGRKNNLPRRKPRK